MSMFSRGVVKKKPVRAESLNLKFGPDPEFEIEVMGIVERSSSTTINGTNAGD